MAVRQIRQSFGQQLQAEQKSLQRIIGQLMSPTKDFVVDALVVLDVAFEQRPGEFILVPEMVEEAALGNADLGDQFVDRGRAEPFASTAASAVSDSRSRFLTLSH